MKMPRRLNRTTPCPFQPGDRIRPTAMFAHHDYQRGESYEVVEIDRGDSTLRARDAGGNVHSWIRWQDCERAVGIGWDWLKGQLPAEALELLSSFDGLNSLRLRQDVRVALMERMPALKERILDAHQSLETPEHQAH